MTLEGVSLRASPLTREALAASGGAAILSSLLIWMVPPGADFAAHVYQRAIFVQHGFALWNNFWYAGRYSFVTYSLLYYPLAALLGIKLLAVATIAAAALVFAVVVLRQWGADARWSTRSFAVVWAGIVAHRRVPVRARRGAGVAGDLGAPEPAAVAVLALRRAHARRQPPGLPAARARPLRHRGRAARATGGR